MGFMTHEVYTAGEDTIKEQGDLGMMALAFYDLFRY